MILPLEGFTSFSIIGNLMTRGNITIPYTYCFSMNILPRTFLGEQSDATKKDGFLLV